nr:MAG TPA: Structural protein [Caudoviricetes sp.]
MPIGAVNSKTGFVGGSYTRDPMSSYTQSFINLAQNILTESSIDIFEQPKTILRRPAERETLKQFFCENFMDQDTRDPFVNDPGYLEDQQAMMEQQFENDANAILEHANMADYNPVIGMTFPVHKNILMNMVFDKGAIQKVVAEGPKFTMTMERRLLVDTKGNEIDMYLNQDKMTAAIDESNPVYDIELTLPEMGGTDILKRCGGTKQDDLSIKTHISAIQIAKMYIAEGDIMPDADGFIRKNGKVATAADAGEVQNVWFPTNIKFAPGYNQYERTFTAPIELFIRKDADTVEKINDTLSGTMDKNIFNIFSAAGKITKVMLSAELDTANHMMDTCTVKWDTTTRLIEIPNAIPLSVTISPEEIKDLAALYQVNQLTKIMSMLKTTLANYKDDKIKQYLDDSYDRLDDRSRGYMEFDYAPPTGYALDPLTWRHSMFFDAFDTEITRMLQVLNDPNMVITIFGDPDLIRKITPVEYSYTTPNSIGAVDLDYKRTVVTSDKRIYQFIGSDKLRWNDTLIVLLMPHNTNRVTYRIYDYQMYVSNEIRNAANPTLPAVTAFERFLIDEYQPVQSRVSIQNRSGLRASQP